MSTSEGPKKPVGSVPIPKASRDGTKGLFRDIRRELAKVEWPKSQETNRLTMVVVAVCLMTVGILFAMSFAAEQILHLLQGNR